MRYIRVTNGEPERFSLSKLRQAFPNVSFPKQKKDMLDATLALFDVYPVIQTEKPVGEVVRETAPVLIDGQWVQQWEARDKTAQERAEEQAQKRERQEVTLRQLRLALIELNLGQEVIQGMGSLSGKQKQRLEVELEYSDKIARNATWVSQFFGTLLSKTETEIDEIFDTAETQ